MQCRENFRASGSGLLYILFVVCTYSLIFQVQTRYWPSVQGELVSSGVERFGASDWVKSNQDYVSKALYKYYVSGIAYEGNRVSPWVVVVSYNARPVLERQISSIERFPDGKVKVFYNPDNPPKSYLIIAGRIGISITLLISTLPLISFYYRFYA